ncbi:MAG TPA: polysaccharide biosynthesis tyrosine autokinase [Capillimicrobium sp.]|nr:polysaccharide biosynthesis tyrosine autokinase [Capillimicrobium sp.]
MSLNPASRDDVSLLRAFVDFVRDSWKTIVVTTLAVVVVGLLYSATREEVYESTANVLFRETTISQQVSGVPVFENPQAPSSAGAEMITNVQLLQRDAIARAVHDRLGLSGSILDLQHRVKIQQEGLGNLASITASSSDPTEAQRIAQTWAEVFIAARQEADRRKLGDALSMLNTRLDELTPVERRSKLGRDIQEQVQQLELLQSVQDGGAEIVQPATLPGDPVSPRPRRTLFLSLLFGLALGIAVAAARRALDRKVRTPEVVTELTGLPVIAQFPESLFGGRVVEPGSWAEEEQFRTAAINIRYLDIGHDRRVLALTSARPQEGKTTIAANLAAVLARMGHKVSLVDGDLRRARLFETFGVERSPGLTEVVAGYADPRDAWRRVDLGDGEHLRLLPSGMQPPNPLEMLTSDTFRRVVSDEKVLSDYVLIDTPPVLVVSDAVPLAEVADAVLLVIRAGQTTKEDVRRTMRSLEQVGIRAIGAIVTGVSDRRQAYYQYGGYYEADGSGDGPQTIEPVAATPGAQSDA